MSPFSRSFSRRMSAWPTKSNRVGIAGGLLGQVGVARWQGVGEVADSGSGSFVQSSADVVGQNGSAPSVGHCLLRIP